MKRYITVGERVTLEMPFSEACMSMQVAGKLMQVEMTTGQYPMAQLFTLDGKEYSFPVTTGAAGIYQDSDGYYISVLTDKEYDQYRRERWQNEV